MAHTKAKGTTKLGRDSESKRLGVKIYGGSAIKCGQIIIRQRGTKYMPGEGVKRGKDDTLYAIRDGVVKFVQTRYTNFTGNKQIKQRVTVIDADSSRSQLKKIESDKKKIQDNLQAKEEITLEKRSAETDETEINNPKSEIIEQEQPIKMITINKEVKKAPKAK